MLKYIALLFLLMSAIIAKQLSHIDDLQWRNRIIIVINDKNFDFQEKIKQNQMGVDERKISIIFYNKKAVYFENKLMSEKFSISVSEKLINIDENHRIILIGKDGGIKSSYSFETDLGKIFRDIDQMPMRRNELKVLKRNKK